jgi:8-oxo-dGTP pyrophosphatase MutT (NUDIX family)
MDITEFVERLQDAIESGLPGEKAHKLMLPFGRLLSPYGSGNTKESAVLILVDFNLETPSLTFIEKAKYDGLHSGQIAFPGGKFDSQADKNFEDTAIRETLEEVGYKTEKWQIVAQLSELYIPVSDMIVYPFVAVAPLLPALKPNSNEVERVFNIPLGEFVPENIKSGSFTVKEHTIEAPYWYVSGQKIWGATAMIVIELVETLFGGNGEL